MDSNTTMAQTEVLDNKNDLWSLEGVFLDINKVYDDATDRNGLYASRIHINSENSTISNDLDWPLI